MIHVQNIRVENGGGGIYLKKAGQGTVYHINVENITWASSSGPPGYFVYGETGLTLADSHFNRNVANNRGITGESSIDGLEHCALDEDYGDITIRRVAVGNFFALRGAGAIKLPSGASNNVISGGTSTKAHQ